MSYWRLLKQECLLGSFDFVLFLYNSIKFLNYILFFKTIFHPLKTERTNDFLVGTGFTVDKEIRSVKGIH